MGGTEYCGVLNLVTTRSKPKAVRLGFMYFFMHFSSQCDPCKIDGPHLSLSPTIEGA
jgi:hypothetical protein